MTCALIVAGIFGALAVAALVGAWWAELPGVMWSGDDDDPR
jgi:hypothetical protein